MGVQAVDDVVLAIRPESIRLASGAGSGPVNRLDGTVAEVTFLGNLVDCQVEIAGSSLRVQAERHTTLEVGQPVELRIPASECVAMRPDGGTAG